MKRQLILLSLSYLAAGFFGVILLMLVLAGPVGTFYQLITNTVVFLLVAISWPIYLPLSGGDLAIKCACFVGCGSLAYVILANVLPKPHIEGICPMCGYDLRATPNRCPECGHERI